MRYVVVGYDPDTYTYEPYYVVGSKKEAEARVEQEEQDNTNVRFSVSKFDDALVLCDMSQDGLLDYVVANTPSDA